VRVVIILITVVILVLAAWVAFEALIWRLTRD
jgi:hypothetical protein